MDNGTTEPQSENQTRPRASVNRRGGLGRGLGALFPTGTEPPSSALASSVQEVPIRAIVPNPYQPRAKMDPQRLQELADSIRTHGVVQPLIVTRGDNPEQYVLIAGERRWRAAQAAGLERVPIIVKEATPVAMLELALVENLVRADLSPLEEAAAYRQLIDDFGLTQTAIAERVGRSRVSITNTLRLLSAPDQIQEALSAGTITEGHARALLGLPTAADQLGALEIVVEKDLTVRQTEALVRRWLAEGDPRQSEPPARDPEEERVEDRFRSALGARVVFKRSARGGGALTIHYHSAEELEALYQRLVGEDVW